jgi:hypothetical protein
MRSLATFGLSLAEDLPDDPAGLFIDAANRDVGRILDHDLHLKYTIFKMLLNVNVLTKDCLTGITYRDLLLNPKLNKIFVREFLFYWQSAPSRKEGDENGALKEAPLPAAVFDQLNLRP